MITITDAWRSAYPGAHAGFLAMRNVSNPASHPELEALKRSVELDLRARFTGLDRKALENYAVLPFYSTYYKQFKKTYHVQGQLESILFKEKPLPTVAALVEAMFIAEIKNLILTAGHDLNLLKLPVSVCVADGSESYTLMRGTEQTLKAGDMYMADQSGIISSILYGPDQRTQITPQTTAVLFAAYAPPGIDRDLVNSHLEDIRGYAQLIAPGAIVEHLAVYTASK